MFGTDKRRGRDGTAWLPDRRAFGAIGRREEARGTIAYAPQPYSLARSGLALEQDEHVVPRARGDRREFRSEEHTSELQSLMRISYAVFCLKKKNNNTYSTHIKIIKQQRDKQNS